MKKLIAFVCIMMLGIAGIAAQDNIAGDWTPDGASWLGDIKIKSMGGDEYKIRFSTSDGVFTTTGKLYNGTLYADFEDEAPEYGEYWVENGDVLVGRGGGGYSIHGKAAGWIGSNQRYCFTSSRYGCATVRKHRCYIKLEFTKNGMDASLNFKSTYLKNGNPMFYQGSTWVSQGSYTCW